MTPAQAYAFEQMRDTGKRSSPRATRNTVSWRTRFPASERKDLADFFFWTAWAAGTDRPGLNYSYTNNWPSDRTVGNTASAEALVWSLGVDHRPVRGAGHRGLRRPSVRVLLRRSRRRCRPAYRLLEAPVTPSQRASAKFFLVAGLLFVVQIFNGGLLAHYTVHPGTFYVKFIGEMYPYSLGQDLAPATRHPLDRRFLDGHGGLPGAAGGRQGAAGPGAAGQHPVRRGRGRDGGQPAGRGPGHQGLLWASTPGSGSGTRAGSISSWDGCGRSCSSAG